MTSKHVYFIQDKEYGHEFEKVFNKIKLKLLNYTGKNKILLK